jgi:hypothetical protein
MMDRIAAKLIGCLRGPERARAGLTTSARQG